jgi:hypothetical protein
MPPYTPANTVLLTGAGFTKNFGGYLASELWAILLNDREIQIDEQLRQLLVGDPHLNFEAVYHKVQSSDKHAPEQKLSFTRALRRVYAQMDALLCDSADATNAKQACATFMRLFSGSRKDRTLGFVFTLNQDLLVERFYSNADGDRNDRVARII